MVPDRPQSRVVGWEYVWREGTEDVHGGVDRGNPGFMENQTIIPFALCQILVPPLRHKPFLIKFLDPTGRHFGLKF